MVLSCSAASTVVGGVMREGMVRAARAAAPRVAAPVRKRRRVGWGCSKTLWGVISEERMEASRLGDLRRSIVRFLLTNTDVKYDSKSGRRLQGSMRPLSKLNGRKPRRNTGGSPLRGSR